MCRRVTLVRRDSLQGCGRQGHRLSFLLSCNSSSQGCHHKRSISFSHNTSTVVALAHPLVGALHRRHPQACTNSSSSSRGLCMARRRSHQCPTTTGRDLVRPTLDRPPAAAAAAQTPTAKALLTSWRFSVREVAVAVAAAESEGRARSHPLARGAPSLLPFPRRVDLVEAASRS